MNKSQRFYELNFRDLLNAERYNTSNYFRSLDLIMNRKIKIKPQKPYIIKKAKDTINDFFFFNNKRKYQIKLNNIIDKPVIPKLNKEYIKIAETLRISNDRKRDLYFKALSLENEKLSQKIFSQKPRAINVRLLEKLNSETHDKYLEILRNPVLMKKSVYNYPTYLPKIYKPNKVKYHFRSKTESNLEPDYEHSEELKEHNHKEISHQRRGHINENQYDEQIGTES